MPLVINLHRPSAAASEHVEQHDDLAARGRLFAFGRLDWIGTARAKSEPRHRLEIPSTRLNFSSGEVLLNTAFGTDADGREDRRDLRLGWALVR
jgi:hypothetical protein